MVEDGVYLDMSAEEYFAVDAIGSSDLVRLHQRREGFWWGSSMNPDYRDTTTKAKTYGTALHAILLEGVEAYEARFAVVPEPPAGCVGTIPEMRAALQEAGLSTKGTSAWAKEDWERAMADNLPARPCWGNILRQFERDRGQKSPVTAVEDRQLRVMHTVAKANPEISKLLDDPDHPALAEVSVFWTAPDGIRFRWRFDRLYPAFSMDLKSLGNWHGRPLAWAVGDAIAKYGMDIQRAHYDGGRLRLYEFLASGAVFGGTIEQRAWLHRFPSIAPKWDWLWLFFQKPSAQGHAPIIFPVLDDGVRYDSETDEFVTQDMSDLHRYGRAKAASALALYRSCMARFGRDTPWADVQPLHYTSDQYAPNPVIHFPHWIAQEAPTEADAYGDGQ